MVTRGKVGELQSMENLKIAYQTCHNLQRQLHLVGMYHIHVTYCLTNVNNILGMKNEFKVARKNAEDGDSTYH